jgi:hypothetical protein
MELPALKVGKPRPTPVVRGGITEIIRNWKKKRQDRKQAKHEKLLVELAEMVDKRRAELLQREREG